MYIVRNFYQGSPEYRRLQIVVREHYLKHYGATPEPEPSFFVCLTDNVGNVPGYACVGITFGDSGKLFSEYYLNDTLDHTYGIGRARIAEVSSLTSFFSGKGAGKHLLNTVVNTLTLHNYGLIVLTATEQVRTILNKVVDNLDDLGMAEQSRVKDPRVNWGTYYSHGPRVVAARLRPQTVWQSNERSVESRHIIPPYTPPQPYNEQSGLL